MKTKATWYCRCICHRLWTLLAVVVVFTSQATSETIYDCPNDWYTQKDYCYKFEASAPKTYEDAWIECNAFGAGLLHIDNLQEHSFISRYLQTHDPYHRQWYTSGVIYADDSVGPPRFAWQSTGRLLDDSLFSAWRERPQHGDDGVIVYSMGSRNTSYSWSLADPQEKRQYACKIHRREAYRIYSVRRRDDYGPQPSQIDDVVYGPRFIVKPKSIVVVSMAGMPTAPAVLECVVQSSPVSSYKWFKGQNIDTLITSDLDSRYTLTNGKLEIMSPTENKDSDYYTCYAENTFGKVISETVEITFGALGEFSNVPDAATVVNAYEGAKVECSQLYYKPALSYNWMKSDYMQFIRSQFQKYIFMSRNGKLYFSEVTNVDQANYTCMASLKGMNQYSISNLQLPKRSSLPIPLIVQEQAASAVWGPVIQDEFIAVFPSPPLRGYDVTMECFAYGSQNTPFTYQWTRDDGKPIADDVILSDHNRVLVIKNAQLEHSGMYRCTVSRGGARDTKTIKLELSALPYFVTPLRNQLADVGSQLTWICGARGNPSPVYTWYKDGEPIKTDRNTRFIVHNNVLTISDLDKDSHDGMYQCGATNILGTSLTTAQLNVLSFPPNFDKHPMTTELISPESGDVSLPCHPEGAPHPEIVWDKDGKAIQADDKYKLLGNGNLRIHDLTSREEGTYTCTASNTFGEAKMSTQLKITGGATITVPMMDNDVVVNQTVFLRCEASFPKGLDTIYEWLFNGYSIDFRDSHFKQTNDLSNGAVGLYVISAQNKHEGIYICTARTPFNTATTRGYLAVYGPPRQPSGATIPPESVTTNSVEVHWTPGASKGDVVSFHVIQIANVFEEGDWKDVMTVPMEESKNTVNDATDRHLAMVNGLNPGVAYQFRVIAINRYGRGEISSPSSFVRTLSAPPAVVPQNVRGGGGSVGLLTIRWDPLHPSEYGGEPVKYRVYWRRNSPENVMQSAWSKREVDDPEAGLYVVYVYKFNYYILYDVMIQAFNRLGNGPNSTIASVYSAEGLPVKSPENVKNDAYNSTAIVVTWDEVTDNRKNVRGKLLGYQINYWALEDGPQKFFQFIRYYGQRSEGMVIGLTPNTDMVMDVQVFNTAGLGPRSNKWQIDTNGFAPLTYPQEVRIASAGHNKVRVWWRGISWTVDEEMFFGYAIWVWVASEDFASARLIDIDGLVFDYVVDGIEDGFVYALRLAAVGDGGYGVKTPTMYFTMEGQILIDSNFAQTIDTFLSRGTTSSNVISLFYMTSISLCLCFVFGSWI